MKKILLSLFIVVGIFSVDTCFANFANCDGTSCGENPRSAQLAQPCDNKAGVNDMCKNASNAEFGRCRKLKATQASEEILTCAAVKCNPNYYLWLDSKGNSMGMCHSKEHMDNLCKTGCDKCKNGEECVPYIVDIPKNITINGHDLSDTDRKNGAYKECHCAPKQSAEEKYCTFTFEGKVLCENGLFTTLLDDLKIKQSELNGVDCPQKPQTFSDWYKTNKVQLQRWFDENCRNPKIVIDEGSGSSSNAELDNAKNKLQEFFNFAKENRDGWKTADGKFNTKRLAADLSAGVVLGTVGGVVSGVVIKKKQVEKGFDALHCTVGGQTVADWGDEFSVGFQR